MKIKYLIFSLLAVFMLFSCGKDPDTVYQDGQGGIEFTISSDYTTETKVDARDANINVDDFTIELINSQGVLFKRWKTYADYKKAEDKTVLVNAGVPYKLRATYGDSTAVGFDAFYFKGETVFTVDPQTKKSVEVVCKQGNVEVAVVYGVEMGQEYLDYSASVKHLESKDSLFFDKRFSESGYIRPGDLQLYLNTKTSDGISHRYGMKSPYTAVAGDSLTFKIGTVVTPDGTLTFDIKINSTTKDTVINVPIDSYMLSKDAPKFIPEGFDINSGNIQYVEGVKPTIAAVNLNAQAGIGECKMTVSSAYLKSVGWPDEVDFLNMSNDVKSVLERDGLVWTDNMKGFTLASVDFTKVAKIIRYKDAASAKNSFSFTLVDNSLSKKSISATYSLIVDKAAITIVDIQPYDVWAVSVPISLTTDGDPLLLVPKVQPEGGSWVIPAYTATVNGTTVDMLITGLNPGTNYTVRGTYYDHNSEDKTITTESAVQVGNAGFENFYRVESEYTFKWGISYTNDKVVFYPWNEGDTDKWWDTNNAATTIGASTPGYQWAKCFPTVNYTSSSVHGGTKSAQIRSVAVNDYNDGVTTKGGKTQGKLFCDHSFSSRPSQFQFWFKYDSYNSDTFSATIEVKNGSDVIGKGEFTNGSSVSSWTLATADITYTDVTKKATSITINFLSSTKSEPDVKVQTLNILDKEYKYTHTGSCITLDDINLVYGK